MIGMSFLRTPGGSDPNKDQSINEADLDGILRYMCPISGGEYAYCTDKCKGFRTCRVGQRVAVLLETRRKAPERPPERAGNPGGDSIEEKPGEGTRADPGARAMREKARARCVEAIASGDPVAWLMEHNSLTEIGARANVSRWRRKYPDLFAGIARPEPVSSKPTSSEKAAIAEAVAALDDTDEISLEDFLAGFAESEEEPKEEPEEEPEENPNRHLADLMRKEAGLLTDIAAMQEEVWRIRQERKEIERMMSH